MTGDDTARVRALRTLVEGRGPLDAALAALARFDADADGTPVTLTRAHAIRLVNRYRRGEWSAGDAAAWARALGGRGDLGREPGTEDLLGEFLAALADPLAGPLSGRAADDWAIRLDRG